MSELQKTLTASSIYESADQPWRLSIAPMLDVSDRHARYFYRLLAPKALVYTEMVTTGALIYGDVKRHLQYNEEEHPVALQLGGSEVGDLARCAKLGEEWGYDEINLNCGCPSERVQKGAFGACLMAEVDLVADCLKAMQDAVSIPVTVKHRLGLDYSEDYGFVRDFVGTLIHKSDNRVFIAHARNAVLKGLSPKDNREIPPLRYAWHEPYRIGEISQLLWPQVEHLSVDELIQAVYNYAIKQIQQDIPLRFVFRPLLGLFNGQKGARLWRRTLSDAQQLKKGDPALLLQTYDIFKNSSQNFIEN
jgi:tRNA-dihydrouridine synthase A